MKNLRKIVANLILLITILLMFSNKAIAMTLSETLPESNSEELIGIDTSYRSLTTITNSVGSIDLEKPRVEIVEGIVNDEEETVEVIINALVPSSTGSDYEGLTVDEINVYTKDSSGNFVKNMNISKTLTTTSETPTDSEDGLNKIVHLEYSLVLSNFGKYSGTIAVEIISGAIVDYANQINDSTEVEEIRKISSNEWKIFYKDDTNVFLISADYMKNTLVQNPHMTKNTGTYATYGISWNTNNLYTKEIEGGIAEKYLSQAASTSNNNYKAVASMLETEYWENFVNSIYADSAIGGPTVEMFIESWNEKYEGQVNFPSLSYSYDSEKGGYYVGTTSATSDSVNVTGFQYAALYFPYLTTQMSNGTSCNGYWLASPTAANTTGVLNISCTNNTGKIARTGLGYGYFAVRPVVCLNENALATKNASGVWELSEFGTTTLAEQITAANYGDYIDYPIGLAPISIDFEGPEIDLGNGTPNVSEKSIAIDLTVIDNYSLSEITLSSSKIKVYTQDENGNYVEAENAYKILSSPKEITATVNGEEKVVRNDYVLTVSNIGAYTGKIAIEIEEGAVEDENGNPSSAVEFQEIAVKSDTDWKIFFTDEENVFLISSNYVPNSLISENSLTRSTDSYANYGMYWNLTEGDLSTTSIDSDIASKYLLADTTSTGNNNFNAVARLLTPTYWERFKNIKYADSAVGATTGEMFVKSWNQKYEGNSNYGDASYILNIDDSDTGIDAAELYPLLGYDNASLYFPSPDNNNIDGTSKGNIEGYWIARNHTNTTNDIFEVGNNGYTSKALITSQKYGIRPVVCLSADVLATKNETTGIWELSESSGEALVTQIVGNESTYYGDYINYPVGLTPLKVDFETPKLEVLGATVDEENQTVSFKITVTDNYDLSNSNFDLNYLAIYTEDSESNYVMNSDIIKTITNRKNNVEIIDDVERTTSVEYTITLSNFTDYSGTVAIGISQNASSDDAGNKTALVERTTLISEDTSEEIEINFKTRYTITYDLAGGSLPQGKTNPTKYTMDDSFTLNNPEKEGHSFIGWTGSNGNTPEETVTIELGSTGVKSYTANYLKNSYNLTILYVDEDGNELTEKYSKYLEYGTEYNITSPSVPGYTPTQETVSGTMGSQSESFTVQYVANENTPYTINHYIANTEDDGYSLKETETKYGKTNTNTEATEKSYDGFVCQEIDVKTISGDGSTVIDIYYDRKTYTLTYFVDGELYGESESYKYEETITKREEPTKIGYKFSGWSEIPETMPANNVEVTGTFTYDETQTKELSYTVEYYKNGQIADTEIEKITVQVLESDTLTVDKTKINITDKYLGYVFEKTEPAELPDEVNTGDVIKVYYIPEVYTITYDLAGGKIAEENKNPETYTIEEKVTLNNPEKEGYTFIGWTGSNGEVPEKEVTIELGSTGAKSYVANYTINSYTLTYKVDGEIYGEVETLEYGAEITPREYPEKYGYKFSGWGEVPGKMPAKDIELVGTFSIDETQLKELNYTVEYYKDGVKVEEDTQTEKTIVQILEPDTLTVDKTKINITDKYLGYELEKTEPSEIPETVNNGETIKVYYKIRNYNITYDLADGSLIEGKTNPETYTVKDEITLNNPEKEGYTFIGWTGSNGEVPEKEVTIELGSTGAKSYVANYTINSYTLTYKVDGEIYGEVETLEYGTKITPREYPEKYGYKFSGWSEIPETIPAHDVEITGSFIVDETQTKELSYTVEYYKDGVKVEEDTQIIKNTVQVLEPDTLVVDKSQINITDKYLGYMVDKTDPESIPDTVNNGETIKIYYKIDDRKTKELSYTVEYYKDGVKAEEDTKVITETVQILEPNTLNIDKTLINNTEKYYGYKLEKTEPLEISDTVNNGDIIKVYYIMDETQTKELSYTVEYYKDGVKVEEDTKVITETVQVLKPDTLVVDNTLINNTEKYYGYKIEKTEPLEVSNVVNNGDVIKIYYVIDETQTKELSYTVEYYKNDEIADTEIITTTVQVLKPDTIEIDKTKINTTDKFKGYKFDKTEPQEIPSIVNNGDVINVYYIIENYTITYDLAGGKLAEEVENPETYTVEDEIILNNPEKEGYTFIGWTGSNGDTPEEIVTIEIGSTGNKNYTANYSINSYTVTYFVDGKQDGENETYEYGASIIPREHPTKYGYKFSGWSDIPDIMPANNIEVYGSFSIDESLLKELSYTVEYYKNNIKQDSDTQVVKNVVQILEPDTLTVDKSQINITDKYLGYELEKIEPSEIPSVVNNGDLIKVYYKDIKYTITYDLAGGKLAEEVENPGIYTVEDEITLNNPEKEGYTFIGWTGSNGEVPEKEVTIEKGTIEDKNYVANYTINSYTLTYKVDGEVYGEEENLEYGTKITPREHPEKYGYKFSGWSEIPETIPAHDVEITGTFIVDETQTKELSYTVEYYKENEKVEADTQIIKNTVQVLEPDTLVVDKSQINITDKYLGYELEKTEPSEIPDNINNGEVIKIYYRLERFKIEYNLDGGEIPEGQSNPDSYNIKDTITLNNPIKKGHTFVGWTGSNGDTPEKIITISEGTTGDKNYVANYIANIYNLSISYIYEDGSKAAEDYTQNFAYGEKYCIESPKIEGYTPDIAKVEDLMSDYPVEVTVTYFANIDTPYIVEHYKQNIEDDEFTLAETEEKIGKTSEETVATAKEYEGFTSLPIEQQIISRDGKTIIKVNYTRNKYNLVYKVDGEQYGEIESYKYEESITPRENIEQLGYKFSGWSDIPETMPARDIEIKGNLILDETQTKTLSYKIEYYKDNEKVEEDTYEETKEVHVLEPDTLTLDKTKINIVDKYVGYNFIKTEPSEIPDMVNNGTVIKIYYELQKYNITYDLAGGKLAEGKDNPEEYSQLDSFTLNNPEKEGYTFIGWTGSNGEVPEKEVTIEKGTTGDKNYIANYTINSYKLTINYVYKDGNEVTDKYTATLEYGTEYSVKSPIIARYTADIEIVSGKMGASDIEINVIYSKDLNISYIVEHYKQNLENDEYTLTDTEKKMGAFEELTEATAKDYVGFTSLPIEQEMVNEDGSTIIKIYYNRNTYTYRVEYYYEEIKDESKDETIESLYDSVINECMDKNITGYEFDRVENLPLRVSENSENNVIKIYYKKQNFEYTVKYLFEGIEATEKEEKLSAKYENVIENYPDKVEYGYELEKTENLPLTITEKVENNIIKVYYVRKNVKVTINHIDKTTGEILESIEHYKKFGDTFESTSKDFEKYLLVESPEDEVIVLGEDDVVLNYYYAQASKGILEKHIDLITDEVIYNELHEGYEGDNYKIEPRQLEGYSIVENNLPENAEGKMKKDVITVVYYYLKNASVTVIHKDKTTGEELQREIIQGYETKAYKTKDKEIEGYRLVEKPSSSEGSMIVTKDSNGNLMSETTVIYYYKKISGGVIERHYDIKTNELLEENIHSGLVDEEYKINSKEFENYCVVEERMPENAEGKMTEEPIEVNYYYSTKVVVKVEYINEKTNEKIIEDIIFNRYEDATYEAEEKRFEGYVIVEDKKPTNSKGTVKIEKDEEGNDITEIIVTYYYIHVSKGVKEQHIDIISNEILSENIYEGNEGDSYVTEAKTFEGYDIVEDKKPENAEGTMQIEEVVVKYYYIRKSNVKVEYINKETNEKLGEDVIIEGHQDDEYKTEQKEFEGYKFVEHTNNTEGKMKKAQVVVRYYYEKIKTEESNNNNQNNEEDNNNNTGNDNLNGDGDSGTNQGQLDNSDNNGSNTNNNNNNNSSNPSNNSSNNTSTNQTVTITMSNQSTNSNGTTSQDSNTATKVLPYAGDILPKVAIIVAIALIGRIIFIMRKKK